MCSGSYNSPWQCLIKSPYGSVKFLEYLAKKNYIIRHSRYGVPHLVVEGSVDVSGEDGADDDSSVGHLSHDEGLFQRAVFPHRRVVVTVYYRY